MEFSPASIYICHQSIISLSPSHKQQSLHWPLLSCPSFVNNFNFTCAPWRIWWCPGAATTAACVQCWVPPKYWCRIISIRSNWHPRIFFAGQRCNRIISACTSRPATCCLHRRSTGYHPSLNFPQPTSQIHDPLHRWESFRAGFGASTWEWLTAAKMPRWNFCHKLWKNMGNILCRNRFLLASGSMVWLWQLS